MGCVRNVRIMMVMHRGIAQRLVHVALTHKMQVRFLLSLIDQGVVYMRRGQEHPRLDLCVGQRQRTNAKVVKRDMLSGANTNALYGAWWNG